MGLTWAAPQTRRHGDPLREGQWVTRLLTGLFAQRALNSPHIAMEHLSPLLQAACRVNPASVMSSGARHGKCISWVSREDVS